MQSQTLHIFSLRHKGCPKNFKKWKFFNKKSLLVSWTFLLKYCCYRCPNIGYRGRSYQRKSYFFFGKGLLSLSSYTKRVSKKSNFYNKKIIIYHFMSLFLHVFGKNCLKYLSETNKANDYVLSLFFRKHGFLKEIYRVSQKTGDTFYKRRNF